MNLWLAIRLLKYVGVLMFAMGIAGALLPNDQRTRQLAALWIAAPGFILTWFAGYGLTRELGLSLGEPWISISMVASMAALHETLRATEPGRTPSRWHAALVLGLLFVSLAAMVVRHV
ncbi:hypothetical protein ACNOYE_00600 [Nannocystaceae bacterium ST9]